MKRFHLLNERTGIENRIGFHMLVCLTGTAPGMLMPEFVSIWKQMLPESKLTMPLLGEQPGALLCRESDVSRHSCLTASEGNIREGPD